MNVCGIIAEYNPLHNGHRYHLSQARKETQSGFVVVAMSGSFTQRGEPAVFDKWARARWALLNGADLVIELPTLYSLQSAEFLLEKGFIDAIVPRSELRGALIKLLAFHKGVRA